MKFFSPPFVVHDMVPLVEEDFSEIYQTHHRRVLGLCRYLLNSPDSAEDAAHEVFLRAQSKFDSYDRALPLSTWLMGIASHYCIDVLRRRGVETRLFAVNLEAGFEPSSPGASPLSEVLAAERGGAVRRALAALPDKFRIPLTLAYYNELNYDEIGAVLDLKRSHVATLLFRGKQQMRRILGNQEKQHGMS
jgi:RNA polymerase sigma-70 factor (ECF subfamily)